MSRLTLLVAAVVGACLVLAGTAYAQENETPTPEPEPPVVVETPVAPPPVHTAIAPVDETPVAPPPPVEETAVPVDETPMPVDETPSAGGAARYELTVGFNTSVTQDDYDEVDAVLRAYDDELEYVILESWPPVGRAQVATDVADFCQTVQAELEAKSYIDRVSCELVEPGPEPPAAPDGDDVVIAPEPRGPDIAPGAEDLVIAPPTAGAGSAAGSSWSWWPLAVAGAAAAGTAGALLAYAGRRAKP